MKTLSNDTVAYLNGAWLPLSEARIPVLDRGFIFGDGVYEVVPVYATAGGHRPFRLTQHLARLTRSLDRVRIKNPFDEAGWCELIEKVIAVNAGEMDNALVYIQLTRGVAPRLHSFPADVEPTVFMMVNPMTLPDATVRAQGVAAVTAPDERWLRCDIKSISLLGNVLMAQHALEHDAVETIQLRNGELTEGSSSNVWLVNAGRLLAPPRNSLILEGIRYGLIEEIARAANLSFEARTIAAAQLHAASEIILSSAGKEIVPVTKLDGRAVGDGRPGPVFSILYEGYQRIKQRELFATAQSE